jgi:hypothetical protein
MAGTRARRSQRCKQPMGTGGLLSCSRSADKVRLLMVQTFIYSAVMYGAEVWEHDRRRSRQDVVNKLSSIQPASPNCSSDVLYGDTGLQCVLIAAKRDGSTDARTWRLADGPREAAILIRG